MKTEFMVSAAGHLIVEAVHKNPAKRHTGV